MKTQEYIEAVSAVFGALGAIATVIAHLPFVPARWAELAARFASYASQASFSVSKREPKAKPPSDDGSGGSGAEVVHITIPPEGRIPSAPPPAALRSLLLACVVLACSPAATKQAEAVGDAAAACLANPEVKSCLVGLTCEGPDKACATAKLAYAAACLDLCRSPSDAGTDQ